MKVSNHEIKLISYNIPFESRYTTGTFPWQLYHVICLHNCNSSLPIPLLKARRIDDELNSPCLQPDTLAEGLKEVLKPEA